MKRRTFADFHRANPDVFRLFRQFAIQLRMAQEHRGSAEQVLWYTSDAAGV